MDRRRRVWSQAEDDVLRKLYGVVPAKSIALHLHRTPKAVSERAFDLGLSAARLEWTREMDGLLVEMRGDGESFDSIAAKFGISGSAVSRRWRKLRESMRTVCGNCVHCARWPEREEACEGRPEWVPRMACMRSSCSVLAVCADQEACGSFKAGRRKDLWR